MIGVIVIAVLALVAFSGKNDSADNNGTMGTSTDSTNGGANSGTGANGAAGGGTGGASGGANVGTPSAMPSDATLTQIMGVSKLRVPQTGTDVVLTGGKANYVSGTSRGQVSLGSILAKVTTNDGYDVFANMSVTQTAPTSRTGADNYLVLFHVKGDVATYTSSILIGQGLPVRSVEAKRDTSVSVSNNAYPYLDSVAGYFLTVSYLDRRSGEYPPTAPTVVKDFTARVKNHILSK